MILSIISFLKVIFSICFVLGSIALLHEFGHYITAKLTNIRVIEFAIGFGNRLFRVKWGETIYSLRPFPLGGFVRLAGMDPDEEDPKKNVPTGNAEKLPDQPSSTLAESSPPTAVAKDSPKTEEDEEEPKIDPNDPRGFQVKPAWVKIVVLAAGSTMNLVWAAILFMLIYSWSGGPLSNIAVMGVMNDSPAKLAGIKAGDVVSAINGQVLVDWNDGIKMIQQNAGNEIILQIERDHQIPKASFGGALINGDFAINRGTYFLHNRESLKIPVVPNANGRIGISLMYNNYDFKVLPLGKALQKGIETTLGIIEQMLDSIYRMIKRESPADLAGPVKIIQIIKEHSQKTIFDLFYLTAQLSLNIGIINLFPFPVLDGGRIVFVVLELFFSFIAFLTGLRFTIATKIEEGIHFVGMLFLLLLLVMVTYKEILSFF
ncbi:site-2 protease family protein [bacterium]|nr:site-2 protease family protein [bacterium]